MDIDSRIEKLEEDIGNMRVDLATMSEKVAQGSASVSAMALTMQEHTQKLTEYSLAQKIVHWLLTMAATVAAAWAAFVGKN